jgi:AcrR family transcriptional regulator
MGRKRPNKPPRRDREDWLETARKVLIESGVDRVKIEPLARLLRVTTGSFYHHFKNRQELLDALLHHWETHNSKPLFNAVEAAGSDPGDQIDALFETWVAEDAYDPAYDSAVRAWAHTSKDAESVVRLVDERRIRLIQQIFEGFGYDQDRAFIRARITYFHQVGYQATEIVEPYEQRQQLRHLYREALVGDPPAKSGQPQ